MKTHSEISILFNTGKITKEQAAKMLRDLGDYKAADFILLTNE
jgi:uncharacterized lipoprotein YehR (DUF1307 family)